MDIISWNINSINISNQEKCDTIKSIISYYSEFICLQEVKSTEELAISRLNSCCNELSEKYNIYVNSTRGYSGTATLVRKDIDTFVHLPIVMNVSSEFDKYNNNRILLSFNKEIGLLLINTYIPNAGAGLVRMEFKKQWMAEFNNFVNKSQDVFDKIIIIGDMNVIPSREDMKNYNANYNVAAGVTDTEQGLYNEFLTTNNMKDIAVALNKRNEYTFFGRSPKRNIQYNAGWRLDHCWVTDKVTPISYNVHKDLFGSDHMPFSVKLQI